MEEEKKGFVAWIKAHKKKLIIAGVSIGAIIAIVLGIKNKDTLIKMWTALKGTIKEPVTPISKIAESAPVTSVINIMEVEEIPTIKISDVNGTIHYPFHVSDHIRNLHPGWKASADKIAEAEMLGIVLQSGQTIVDGYTKGGMAA